MSRSLVVGDIHGRADALEEVLEKCNFDRARDTLISLGDIVDGGRETKRCFEILETIPNKILIMGNHDCLTPDTEALTKRGWVKYNELTSNDKVFSLDTDNEVGKWMPISNVIIKEYSGEMVVVDKTRFRMMVTPTHRILCSTRKSVKDSKSKRVSNIWVDYKYINASKLKNNRRLKIYSSISDKNQEYNISDDKIRLTAWILTDGCVQGKEKNYNYISIYQSKSNHCKDIENILNNLNYKYSINTRNRDIKSICGKILLKPPLSQTCFGICAKSSRDIYEYFEGKEKLPSWIFKLSDRQFKIFLNTLISGDGHVSKSKKSFVLYGTKKILEDIQTACITKGYCATFVIDARGDPRLNICEKNEIEFETSSKLPKNGIFEEHYEGTVWCIETPLTNFMVRYKGTCYFTGNSWTHNWMLTGQELPVWVHQGGYATMESYGFDRTNVPDSHIEMLRQAHIYYIDSLNNLYVHGGLDPKVPIEKQPPDFIMWDRDLVKYAHKHSQRQNFRVKPYNHIFTGHTSTQFYKSEVPLVLGNVIMLDTGAGHLGKLSIMNIETLEYWQSEKQGSCLNKTIFYKGCGN